MSYGWLGSFRKGAWLSLRSFVMRERKDVGKRVAVINSEVRKIGTVTVMYNKSTDVNGLTKVTEKRDGFSVDQGSLLEKLLQAYIVAGGNPLDVSQFFIPDRTVISDGESYEEYPYGGVIYPMSSNQDEASQDYGIYTGGYFPLRKYKPLRMGGRLDVGVDAEVFVSFVSSFRKPVQQEIRFKIHDMESRIIKICDLKEQLITERNDILMQAFGGLSPNLVDFDKERFALALRVPKIADYIDSVFFIKNEDGSINFDETNTIEILRQANLWDDMPEESNTAI